MMKSPALSAALLRLLADRIETGCYPNECAALVVDSIIDGVHVFEIGAHVHLRTILEAGLQHLGASEERSSIRDE